MGKSYVTLDRFAMAKLLVTFNTLEDRQFCNQHGIANRHGIIALDNKN